MFTEQLLYYASAPVVDTFTTAMLKMDIQFHTRMPAGGKIVAANHPSTTDPFFVAAVIREKSFILINNVLFQVPVLGTYLRYSGHIPVVAGGGQAALDAAAEHLRAGHTILIFPEGDLSPETGGFQEPRTGTARLALMTGAPVIPVGVHLAHERCHVVRSIVKGEEHYGRWYLNGPYNVTVGDALHYSGDVEDRPHVRKVANLIMHQIIELAHESKRRLDPTPSLAAPLPTP